MVKDFLDEVLVHPYLISSGHRTGIFHLFVFTILESMSVTGNGLYTTSHIVIHRHNDMHTDLGTDKILIRL